MLLLFLKLLQYTDKTLFYYFENKNKKKFKENKFKENKFKENI